MRNEKITPLCERLSRNDELQGESNFILHQELICKGWFMFLQHYASIIIGILARLVFWQEIQRSLT